MTLKVLIVEDDLPNLELMNEILCSAELQVRPISDSEIASALVAAERFDGIFVDLEMPKVHGFELVRRIRESSWNQSTPIIIVTGSERPAAMKSGFKVGGSFFLHKPIERYKLLRLLRAVRGSMLQNRRRFVRVHLKTAVVCDNAGRVATGMSSNISDGGILLEVPNLSRGNRARLSFQVPGSGKVVEAVGIVERIDGQGRAGIRFLEINESGREAIRLLVDEHG
jgi:CheY-like chemotaxis protein